MKNRLLALSIFFFSLFGCATTLDEKSDTSTGNNVYISKYAYFDNTTKRYVFTGNPPLTRSSVEWAEAESIARENALLDSLCNNADKKGVKPVIIYAKSNKKKPKYMTSSTSPDDSCICPS